MGDLAGLVRQVVEVCLNVRKGENVWVHSWDHTTRLASELAFACRQHGAHPFITLVTEKYWARSLSDVPKRLLETLPSHEAASLEQTDVFIFMLGPKSPIKWDRIPAEKRQLANVWYSDSNKYLDSWWAIGKKRGVRTLGIEYCLATKECARAWGLGLERWREVMLTGCLTDQQEITKKAAYLAKIIQTGHKAHVQTPSGTDLRFRLTERQPIVGDSVVSRQDAVNGTVKFLPSGFVEVAADEDSAEGTVVFDSPILVRYAKRIKGLTLKLEKGKIVDYSAQSGVTAFRDYIDSGQGDADKFGFFGLGLNRGLKHGFTQDDKVLGGVTIGIGGNEDKGGRNRTPENRHWWASMTHATVLIDGEALLKHGTDVFWKPR
jgi:leucyl aminopeptidase (aminopeptidase T)